MTLKEFEKILKENKELFEKFKKSKEEYKFEEGKEAESMSKLVASLGYDVPASEFALAKIGKKEVNEEELKSVAGGGGKVCPGNHRVICSFTGVVVGDPGKGCIYDYKETDCNSTDFCDIGVIYYPSKDECRYDYRDTDCAFYDYCDFWNEEY